MRNYTAFGIVVLFISGIILSACPATPRKRKREKQEHAPALQYSPAQNLMARAQTGELTQEQYKHSGLETIASEKYIRKDGSYYLLLYTESEKLEYVYFYDAQGDKLWEEQYYENGFRKSYKNLRTSGHISEGQKASIEYYQNGNMKKEVYYRSKYGAIEETCFDSLGNEINCDMAEEEIPLMNPN